MIMTLSHVFVNLVGHHVLSSVTKDNQTTYGSPGSRYKVHPRLTERHGDYSKQYHRISQILTDPTSKSGMSHGSTRELNVQLWSEFTVQPHVQKGPTSPIPVVKAGVYRRVGRPDIWVGRVGWRGNTD